jgi:DNA replication protein DnaC
MRHYRTADLLLIDDLGVAKNSEWVEEAVYRIIGGRYEQMRPTIYTTNLDVPKLRDALGDRIASRLAETCTRVLLDGDDRRRQR